MSKNPSPIDKLNSLAKKREQITTNNSKKMKSDETTTVRTSKELVYDIKRFLINYRSYPSITDFVNSAIEEKLEREEKKYKK